MPASSPAMLEKIVASTHADEAFQGYAENEWEPENRHVTLLKELWEPAPSKWSPQLRSSGQLYSGFIGPNTNVVFVASPPRGDLDWTKDKQLGEVTMPQQSVQTEIAKCIAARPHESITLFSKLGIVTFVFVLLVYFVGGVLIVNPVFAFFGLLACGLFWTMAVVDKRSYHRSR